MLGFVAAPAIFATLEASDPAGGRALAGLVFGAVFTRFQDCVAGHGAILIGLLIAARAARTTAAAAGLARLDGGAMIAHQRRHPVR